MTDSLVAPHGSPQLTVVFVTTVFDDLRTGPAVYARYLWEAFRDDPEIEFHVVAPDFPEAHPRWHPSGRKSGGFGFYRALCRAARELVRQLGPHTLLHTNNCHTGTSLLRLGVQVIGQINDYENVAVLPELAAYWRQYGWRRCGSLLWRRWRERRAVHRQSVTVCNSDFVRRKVFEEYAPLDPGRLVTIYKAVDLEAFRRPRVLPPDPLARPDGRRRLVCVGSNPRVKGLDYAVAALDHLREVHLAIVGVTEAEFRKALPSRAARDRPGNISCLGRVDRYRLPGILWHSDALLLLSRSEALGVAILEALAAGLPVVAGRVGGIPEIMTHPDCGELVSPGDPRAVAAAVARVLSDRCAKPGPRPAVEAILERFSREAMIGEVRRLYLSDAVR